MQETTCRLGWESLGGPRNGGVGGLDASMGATGFNRERSESAASPPADESARPRRRVKVGEVAHGLVAVAAAHRRRRPQASTDLGPFRLAEDAAAELIVELRATHAGRLSIGHPGNRR